MIMILKNKGFTLVETLIYTALIGIVLTGFVSLALNISAIKSKQMVMAEVNTNTRQFKQFLTRQIREADSVISPLSGATSSSLVLLMPNAVTRQISVVGSRISIQDDGGEIMPLTNSRIAVNGLMFTNYNSENVKVNFNLGYQDSGSQEFVYQINFSTAVTLRN